MAETSIHPAWLADAPPLYEGAFGKAWKFPMPTDTDDWRIAVGLDANYLIFAPGAHPWWSWHAIMAISLCDVAGQPPAHRQYPDATHELMVWALDPGHPAPDPRLWPMPPDDGQPRPLHLLSPPDAVVQFDVFSDDHAVEIIDLAAKACTTGHLVPDSDHRSSWESAIAATAAHYRSGIHG